MRNMRDISLIYAMAAMCGDGIGTGKGDIRPESITGKLPTKPIPKGCKEYFFNKNGGFSTDKMLRTELVFKCIALNDKSAKKKFENWLNSEQNPEVSDTTQADSSNAA